MKDFWDSYTYNADGKLVRRGYVSLSEQPPKDPSKELASTLDYAAHYGWTTGFFMPDHIPRIIPVKLPKDEFDPAAPEADLIYWDENLMV